MYKKIQWNIAFLKFSPVDVIYYISNALKEGGGGDEENNTSTDVWAELCNKEAWWGKRHGKKNRLKAVSYKSMHARNDHNVNYDDSVSEIITRRNIRNSYEEITC